MCLRCVYIKTKQKHLLPLFCPWSVLMLWKPQQETPAVNTVSTSLNFPWVLDLQQRIRQQPTTQSPDSPCFLQIITLDKKHAQHCLRLVVLCIHLFCLEPKAVSCCPPSAAPTVPAVDTCNPADPEHRVLLSLHQTHRWPEKVDRQVRSTRITWNVLQLKKTNNNWRSVALPCLIESKNTVLSSYLVPPVSLDSFEGPPGETHRKLHQL